MRRVLAIIIFVMLFYPVCSVRAQFDVCRSAGGEQDNRIRIEYGNRIDFFLRIAAALQQKGIDPSQFAQATPGGGVEVINIPALVQQLSEQRDQALASVFAAFQECESGFAPYQKIVDVGVFFVTAGLSQIIPPAATHIDVSNILGGTPLGGNNALVPKARDDALRTLGIGGDVAKVIRNPRCIFGC